VQAHRRPDRAAFERHPSQQRAEHQNRRRSSSAPAAKRPTNRCCAGAGRQTGSLRTKSRGRANALSRADRGSSLGRRAPRRSAQRARLKPGPG
jgi:hypothetical protein